MFWFQLTLLVFFLVISSRFLLKLYRVRTSKLGPCLYYAIVGLRAVSLSVRVSASVLTVCSSGFTRAPEISSGSGLAPLLELSFLIFVLLIIVLLVTGPLLLWTKLIFRNHITVKTNVIRCCRPTLLRWILSLSNPLFEIVWVRVSINQVQLITHETKIVLDIVHKPIRDVPPL